MSTDLSACSAVRAIILSAVFSCGIFFCADAAFGETPAHSRYSETGGAVDKTRAWFVKCASGWEFCPDGLVFPAYLAGTNESRIGGVWNHDDEWGWIWDATLGGHFGLLRKGRLRDGIAEGFQVDFEGAAHLRLDFENNFDLASCDYRCGIPVTWGNRIIQLKTGYYHMSSHLGDEVLVREAAKQNWVLGGKATRESYARDALILAVAWRPHPNLRFYGELDYNLIRTGTSTIADDPIHLQCGVEYSEPYRPGNPRMFGLTPFAAIHAAFYQECDYDGNLCIQAGFQKRLASNRLFRFGFQYYYGVGEQYQNVFNGPIENKCGFGLWYDF